jgi:hypothetical protein
MEAPMAKAPEVPSASPGDPREVNDCRWRAIATAAIIFAALSISCAVTSQGFLEADACTHYQYARFALSEPHYLVNVWGRPFVTALYSIPAVLVGRIGVRLSSLAFALLIALVAFEIAKNLRYRWPALAFVFTLAQPLLFLHSFSELTELPFALLLAGAFGAYVNRQWFVMALLAGLLPTARPEGFGFLLLAAIALAMHRKLWVALLPLPLLVWCYAGWRVYGSPIYSDTRFPHALHWLLWLRHNWPYSQRSTYESGYLLHFIALLPVVVSPFLLPFFGIGTAVSVRLRGFFTDHRARCQTLIAALPLIVLAVHSLLYWLGRMASNGEARYMLVVAPFWALLAARGWEWTFTRLDWRHPMRWSAAAALLPVAVNWIYPVLPLNLTHDGRRAQAVAHWYGSTTISVHYPRILASNPEIAYFMGVSHTDRAWVADWRKEVVDRAPPGTVMVWDPTYGLHNASADRVITLDEIQAAGWVEHPELAEPINDVDGDGDWRVFLSPRTISGR